MNIRRTTWSALLLWFIAPGIYSDESPDWYVSGAIGWGYADRVHFAESDALLEFDRGRYLASGALGLQIGEDWRLELDASTRRNTPEILYSANAAIEIDPDPKDIMKANSLMFNVLRDIPIGIAWRPYIGAGIGVTKLDYRLSENVFDAPSQQQTRRDIVNDQSTTFAYQLILGFTVPVTQRFSLAADYRYWQAPSPGLKDSMGNSLKVDHTVHSAWLHFAYHGGDRSTSRRPSSRTPALQGFYVKSSLGGGIFEDAGIEGTNIGIDAFDLGPVATLALGYTWRKTWRIELEGAYRSADVEVIDFRPAQGEDPASGDVTSYSLMANAIYQFLPKSTIRPFVGIGGGFVRSSFDINVFGICEFSICGAERRRKLVDDSDNARVIQAMFGVDVALSPRSTFFADYRYWVTSDFNGLRQPDASRFQTYLRNNSVMVGFRHSLGAGR